MKSGLFHAFNLIKDSVSNLLPVFRGMEVLNYRALLQAIRISKLEEALGLRWVQGWS